MAEKLTQKFIKNELKKKGYKLIGKYINAQSKMTLKDKEGYLYSITWNSFQQGKEPKPFHKSNPHTIQNIKLWMKTNAVGHELLSEEYLNNRTKLHFKCDKGHEYEINWNNFKTGYRCPYCSNQRVLKGYNDIATTNPWMIDLGMSREDAEKYSYGSNNKVIVICPHCGKQKQTAISDLYNDKSIGCSCGDGIPYSEKFIVSILNQLNIKYIKEYKPKWNNGKRYDFYLEDYNIIIECHGIQHYIQTNREGARTLQEEQKNDKYKKQLALDNGIKTYIELDCKYSELEYIKQSILNSELNNLFDLSKIDWLMCEEYSLKNVIKEVCDYWYIHNEVNNEELTVDDISKLFNLGKATVYKYLRQGTKLKWCNYIPKQNNKKPIEIFKDGKSLGIFESGAELERQSEELFGVKLIRSGVSSVCKDKISQYKGFTFKYV